MKSIILRSAARFLLGLLVLFAIFLLARGHNEPGGGFAAGLVASAAVSLYAMAYGVARTREVLRVDPRTISALGLLLAAGSGAVALLVGETYFTGQWVTLELPGFEPVKVGTPLVFDGGVFLTVTGSVLAVILSLGEGE